MASQTLTGVEDRFPVGTTVSVYARPPAGAWNGSSTPPGNVVTTGVVGSDGSVTFSGLTETAFYLAYAGGRSVNFRADPPSPLSSGSSGGVILPWAASTAYKQGQPVTYSGQTYTANADFTSGGSFNAANWTVLPASGGALATLSDVQGTPADRQAPRFSASVGKFLFRDPLTFDATDYGVKANGKLVTDGAITGGSNQLSSSQAAFTSADAGKLVVVPGAGTPSITATLSASISGTITALPVTTLAAAVPAGPITVSLIGPGAATDFQQTFVTTGAAQGATSIPVTSQAVFGSYASGAGLMTRAGHLHTTISSVSAGVATLAANATTTVTGAEVTFGSDDTTALQACITAAGAASGKVRLPNGQMCTSATLTTGANDMLLIEGQGCFELYGTGAGGGANPFNLPSVAPYLTGSVIVVMAPNVDGLRLQGVGVTQDVRDFGVRFAGRFYATGHGINATPATVAAGIYGATWTAVKVYGHDGDHYGFVRTNWLLATCTNLRSYGGGGCLTQSTGGGANTGNIQDNNPYHYVGVYGTAHGIHDLVNGGGLLNLLVKVRPQTWIRTWDPVLPGICPPVTSQQNLMSTQGTTGVISCCYIAPDWECNVGSATATYPIYASSILGGGHGINASSTANSLPGGTVNSGQNYQNQSGTTVVMSFLFRMDPTAGADATVNLYMDSSATPSTDVSGTLKVPAAGPTGGTQAWTIIVPPGYYFKYVAVNATRISSYATRVPGS